MVERDLLPAASKESAGGRLTLKAVFFPKQRQWRKDSGERAVSSIQKHIDKGKITITCKDEHIPKQAKTSKQTNKKARNLSLVPRNHLKKVGTITICNPHARDGEQVDLQSVNPSLLSELQTNERACLRKTRWIVLEKQPPEVVL